MELKVYNYIVQGIGTASQEIVEQFKTCISSVKGVIKVEIDLEKQAVSYAIDEWTSEYEVFSTLNEICETFKFDLSFEDEEDENQTDEPTDEEPLVVEELQVEEDSFDDEEKEVKKGKLTKSDVVEKILILGISVILLVVGLIIGATNSASAWLLMLAFTLASYETLYAVIIKIAEKKYFVEEIMVFVGALVFMYLGSSAFSAIIMLAYALIQFGIQIIVHKNTVAKERYEIQLEDCTDEVERAVLKAKIEYLALREDEIDLNSAKVVCSQLRYNVIAMIVAVLTAFIPPFFTISNYWGVLTDKWLYVGAIALLLGTFSEVIFAFYNVATLCVVNALNKGVTINGYNAFLNLSKAESVCFDSIGVLTKKLGVVDGVSATDEKRTGELLVTAYQNFESPISKAIVNHFAVSPINGVSVIKSGDTGAKFALNDIQILVGNKRFLKANGITVASDYSLGEEIFACENGKVVGSVKVRFDIKRNSFGAIKEFSNDLGLKTVLLCGESVERATYLKKELEIDSAVSGANDDYKVNKSREEKGIFVGVDVAKTSSLSGLEHCVNFGKVGSVCVENDEIRTVPFVVKLSKRADKTLNFANVFTLISKVLLFAITILLSVFTTFEFALIIVIIDFVCRAITVANTLRNATSVA